MVTVTVIDKKRPTATPSVVCVAMDVATRDTSMLGAEKALGWPGVETVLQVIMTQKGSCLFDANLGVNSSSFSYVSRDSKTKIESEYNRALKFLVPDVIDELTVTAVIDARAKRYFVDISFVDVISQEKFLLKATG